MSDRRKTILIVDDDEGMRETLTAMLRRDYRVLRAATGEFALQILEKEDVDLILLDVRLPGISGFEVLRRIRQISDVPVVMLTAAGEETDHVRGLELGAYDYLVKPFSHLALMAHIKAVLRRADLPPPARAVPNFVAGDLTVNFESEQVTVGGEPVELTPVEYKLLYHLVRNAGRLLPHRLLLDRVWGADYAASPDHLKVFVSRLRAKLGHPDYIETERGVGYRFARPAAAASAATRPSPAAR